MNSQTLDFDQVNYEEMDELNNSASSAGNFELAFLLLRNKKVIAVGGIVCALFATVAVWLIPPSYVAEAILMPPQQQQSSLGAMLSGIGGAVGSSMGTQLGLKNPGDLYVGILKSRTIADDLIKRFGLMNVYHADRLSAARKALGAHSSFTAGKDSLIVVSVKARSARLAADLANGYVDELYKQNSRLAVTDASQRRLFYEQQLDTEKERLAEAEVALKTTEQSTGLVTPTGQAEVLIRSGAQIRAEIASRQVQLQTMRSFATENNPRVELLKQEISALQSQLSRVESDPNGSKLEVSGARLPEASLEYIRKLRDVKYHETLFELLSKQYETARLDEGKEAPVLQVVDRAVVPDKDARMRGPIPVMGAGFFGLIFSCIALIIGARTRQFLADFKAAKKLLGRKFLAAE